MTQRKQFEAWAKSQSLDTDHKENDAWGREQYSPHIHSMWQGWQAAQAQAAVEPFAWVTKIGILLPPYDPMSDDVPLYTSPPDDLKFRPDWSGVEVLAEELREAQKAMRLALEALNNSVDLVWEEYTEAERSYGSYPTRRAKLDGMKAMAQQHDAAIAALEKDCGK